MKEKNFLERPLIASIPAITGEVFLFALIIILALLSRFYDLGTRVMSHDESLHTYFSWLLYKGDGYQHTPMMHGPFQFHLLALSYFLFGVSDFTARIPGVIFNIATIWMLWYWRSYLGKAGALIAGVLILVSPYMLFYGRYVRNEPFSGFAGMLMFLAVLRYLQSGEKRYFYWLTISLMINFTSKETAYIYVAQLLLFLAFHFFWKLIAKSWKDESSRNAFITLITVALLLIGGALGAAFLSSGESAPMATEPAAPANPMADSPMAAAGSTSFPWTMVLAIAALATIAFAAYYLIQGLGWAEIRAERSFDLLMLVGTLIIPLLTPLVSKMLNWSIPTTAPELAGMATQDYIQILIAILLTFGITIGLGLWWKAKVWWKNALLFYSLFTIFFTTIFTNSGGFFTGIFGSLGYWMVQQEVARGGQPWYYYAALQIPIYEFLPALGVWVGVYYGFKKKASSEVKEEIEYIDAPKPPALFDSSTTFALLSWWSLSSLIAYSYAGERMPWLTYHITLPMILLTAWGLNNLVKNISWNELRVKKGWLGTALIFIFFTSLINTILGANGAFQGKGLAQLQATSEFLLPLIISIASGIGLFYIFRDWTWHNLLNLTTLVFFGLLTLWTARAAYRAAYINYDSAKEYLVYAHAARGVKDVMAQAEEISMRTTGDLSAVIAYDASAPDTGISWPFVWYLRDFTNLRSFDAPTRSLREASVIVVDEKNFEKIEPVVGDGYYRSDYIRMWWPNQDYYGLVRDRDSHLLFPADYPCTGVFSVFKLFSGKDFTRVCETFTDPAIRAGVIDIWAKRDFTKYAQATGKTGFGPTDWNPADKMRLYVRKDVASQVWNYGVLPETSETITIDIYEENTITLTADLTVGLNGAAEGQFSAPRGIAFAPDGSFYVADSRNHRIQHFDADGNFINAWGQFGDATFEDLSGGIFNEPWGIAVGPDGSVYVTDTWSHRVQKFDADGTPITRWGYYGQAADGFAFWGPRGIDVDKDGNVYVSDTGNKRIVKFDSDGNFITEFGQTGMAVGEFDEQVGVAVDDEGIVYVTDTWNQRIQTFIPSEDGIDYFPLNQWDVSAWYGQSLDNKPFLTVDNQGSVFVADPEGYRVLQFSTEGEFIRTWGDYGFDNQTFGLVAAVAVDAEGHVWVTDAGNHRVMRFTLPE
ncbi:MAG: TIGR03663 family protein [Chloroflexi bacterium]|nr:TIGR03663 family protein [Chloroflexota bacterium]